MKKLKWGIIGCGGIARKFASDLQYVKGGKLRAVGSRSKAKAEQFAADHGAKRAYDSYEAVVADPDIDIVYVATPHPYHMDNTLLAINAGKHVLCEKPIAISAAQTKRMIAAARQQGVFFMEAMWTRFFPGIIQLKKWLAKERIGDVIAIEADFGIRPDIGPEHRLLNPDLGGGALLDLGIYPVSFASLVYGTQPDKIISSVHMAETGVDDHAVITFTYPDHATAALGTSSIVRMKNQAHLFGTKGRITVHEDFFHPNKLTLEMEGKKASVKTFPYPGNGMQYEAQHVHQCLKKGLTESPIMPLDESLAIMQTMDKIRRQWKLKYPCEQTSG
ncbi:MAG: Gfo/Idh/MocA family protein [Planctomycetota bacterium]|jgi:predicted dehydrogenase